MKNASQAALLLAALLGGAVCSGFTLPKMISAPTRRRMPEKTPEQTAAEIQADKERHEWNMKRDEAYRAKKAAKGKKPHWSALNHFSRSHDMTTKPSHLKPNHPKLAAFIAAQKARGVIVNITKQNTIVPLSVAREWTKFVAKK